MFVLYDFVRGQFVFGSLAGSNNTRGLGINCLYSLFRITQFNSNIEVQTESITSLTLSLSMTLTLTLSLTFIDYKIHDMYFLYNKSSKWLYLG